MVAFIFGGDTTETPETIKRKREIARALMAAQGAPRNVGEGLNALGDGIVAAVLDRRAANAEKTGMESANKAFAPLMDMFSGGGSAPSNVAAEGPAASPASSTVDLSGDKQNFISSLLPAAMEESKRTGVDPRIIVAQAAQETGWGKSAPGNNFFGIKSHGKGGGQSLATHEYIDGKRVNVTDSFRQFGSPQDSVRGYGDFILENPRYSKFRSAQGLDNQLAELQSSGYATDPNYAASVGSIARSIQLPQEVASLDPSVGMPAAAGAVAATGPQAQLAQPQAPSQPSQQVAQAMAAPAQQPQQMDMRAVMQALSNPFLAPGQRAVAEALVQREQARQQAILEQQLQQQDPKYQLDLQKGQTELDLLRNPRLSPAEQARIESDKERLGFDREKFAADQANDALTPDIKEYNFYAEREKSAGRQPLGPLEWDIMRRKSSAANTSVTVGGEPSDGNLRKKLDEKTGELWSTYQEQGATSAAAGQDFQVLDELIKVAPQGPIQGRLAEMFPGVSSAGDAFQSIVKRVAPTLRAPGSGATSDIEYDGMLRSLPALRNRPEANLAINEIMKAKAAINVERSSIIGQYGRGEISAGEARSKISEIDKRSIMTPELKKALEGVGAKPESSGVPEGVDPQDWEFMTPEERKLWQ